MTVKVKIHPLSTPLLDLSDLEGAVIETDDSICVSFKLQEFPRSLKLLDVVTLFAIGGDFSKSFVVRCVSLSLEADTIEAKFLLFKHDSWMKNPRPMIEVYESWEIEENG